MNSPEGFDENYRSPEKEGNQTFTFYDRTKPGNPKLPDIYSAPDADSAYNLYVGLCLENGISPLARDNLSINSLTENGEEGV